MISAENIERAERLLTQTYRVAQGMPAHEKVLAKARVDVDAFDMFASHHKEILFRKYIPDVDPRDEPAIMTMLLHFFAVGATAQRVSEGRS